MISVILTTTSSRLELCAATIWSLVHQNMLPDKINLWISHEAYMADQGIKCAPKWVNELNKIHDIVSVHFVHNTGPYRKIFPALINSVDDDILIYADDDVIYGANWLSELINEFNRHEQRYVVASRVKCIRKNFLGLIQSYNMYKIHQKNEVIEKDFIITGVGGCVLTKKMFKQEYLNNCDFLKIAPKTDDLWISKLLILSGSAVAVCPVALKYVQEIQHYNFALSQTNTTIINGGLIYKLFSKIKNKILGYIGFRLSNNDKVRAKIDTYFKEML